MSKKIDVRAAAEWSEETAQRHLQYLRERDRMAEVNTILDARENRTEEQVKNEQNDEPGSDLWFETANAQQVAEWVGADDGRAQHALEKEQAKLKPREGLVTRLRKISAGQ